MKNKTWLPIRTWRIVLENSVLSTADLVVVRGKGKRREFLLGKRNDRPCRGRWFIFGGKQLKGEHLHDAAVRQLRRELNVTALRIEELGNQDFLGVNNLGVHYHSLMHLHVAVIAPNAKLQPNGEHSSLKWFRTINHRWPSAVRKALVMAGFK